MCEKNLNNWKAVYDILLHEICHAFNRDIHGFKSDNHGPKFKAIATALGCSPTASIKTDASSLNLDYARYVYSCPACGQEYPRSRTIKQSASCSKCDSKFNRKFKLELKSHKS